MSKPKNRPLKQKKSRAPKNVDLKSQLIRILAGLGLLVVLVISAGVLTHHLLLRPKAVAPVPKTRVSPPTFEIYPPVDVPPRKPKVVPPRPPTHLPKVAIIIDDMGYDRQIAKMFMDLNAPLTFSLLPHNHLGQALTAEINKKGLELMLHLPMEPEEYPTVDPGPGALLVSMPPDELIAQLNANLDSVPGIKGVNNHMGSKMTAVSTRMYQVFSVLKQRNLFIVDSRTTPDTLCRPSARLFKVPFAQRDVFLDHVQSPDFIRQQFERLVSIARDNGEAIGIAHPHLVTYDVLRDLLPELRQKVELVPASTLARPTG